MMNSFQRSFARKDILQQIAEGADLNSRDAHGCTALHWDKSPSALKALIKAGADVNARNLYGATPLHRQMKVANVRLLIEAGADVNAVANAGDTPLHAAFHPAAVFELLRAGADPNRRNQEGELPDENYGTAQDALAMRRMVEEVRLSGHLLHSSWRHYMSAKPSQRG